MDFWHSTRINGLLLTLPYGFFCFDMEKMNDLEQRGIDLEGKNEEFWKVFFDLKFNGDFEWN